MLDLEILKSPHNWVFVITVGIVALATLHGLHPGNHNRPVLQAERQD